MANGRRKDSKGLRKPTHDDLEDTRKVPIEYVWVAWRLEHRGWCPRHAVITRADDSPSECAGLKTVCGETVPAEALEYARAPKGPCRKSERDYPVMTEIMRSLDPVGDACWFCLRRVTGPG
jgi:hypothetical protein